MFTLDDAPLDAADVRVHHRDHRAEGEGGDSAGRIPADAGQCEQLGDVRGDNTVVAFHDRTGAVPQSKCPPRVTEVRPGPQYLVDRGVRQIRGGGPAFRPLSPQRFNPGDRGLLRHDLAEQDRPGAGAGFTPGQWTRRAVKPVVEERPEAGVPGVLAVDGYRCSHDRSTVPHHGCAGQPAVERVLPVSA